MNTPRDAVGDVRARPVAGARGEDGAEDGGADGAAERPEEAGRGRGDAEVAPLDAVLHGEHEHLGDHPEAEAEDGERDAGARARGSSANAASRASAERHQREAGDREDL